MHNLEVHNCMMYTDKESPCYICGQPTHYVDICYEARFCSTECMEKFEKDLWK